jgi:hypothetical protein
METAYATSNPAAVDIQPGSVHCSMCLNCAAGVHKIVEKKAVAHKEQAGVSNKMLREQRKLARLLHRM